jgi:hypothetical protein
MRGTLTARSKELGVDGEHHDHGNRIANTHYRANNTRIQSRITTRVKGKENQRRTEDHSSHELDERKLRHRSTPRVLAALACLCVIIVTGLPASQVIEASESRKGNLTNSSAQTIAWGIQDPRGGKATRRSWSAQDQGSVCRARQASWPVGNTIENTRAILKELSVQLTIFLTSMKTMTDTKPNTPEIMPPMTSACTSRSECGSIQMKGTKAYCLCVPGILVHSKRSGKGLGHRQHNHDGKIHKEHSKYCGVCALIRTDMALEDDKRHYLQQHPGCSSLAWVWGSHR